MGGAGSSVADGWRVCGRKKRVPLQWVPRVFAAPEVKQLPAASILGVLLACDSILYIIHIINYYYTFLCSMTCHSIT